MRGLAVILLAQLAVFAQASTDVIPIPDGVSGSGITTRYWDCCKAGCSWQENLSESGATSPVRSCAADGQTTIDIETQSGCTDTGDVAYMCSDQQPWVYNETLSFGWVAASFGGGSEYNKCCHCLLLKLQGQLAGKSMLVQITNTGSPLGQNHFDVAMPGGGAGLYATGCTNEWDSPVGGWGDPISGISSVEECSELPASLQSGCQWRFGWFEGVDNPDVEFLEIECPSELTSISGCVVAN
ncbi:endoglucanase [Dendroctonus ponderosae]|uniref:Cellulase n=1 Tax=Dendroctonus ponderosae TaxID=77166 RepID=E7CIS8_DENPD|nr:endoglucanase [Dendroctonus ponderosae]AEE61846.1 unknown [Dendroctonus ponderosae]ERL84421.1 hypothetical protein D910_01854 [Dendroctonus ponderosae]KAH1026225.1 hypothetical protein HUJ05_010773 [Dendroctonus ponderosae]